MNKEYIKRTFFSTFDFLTKEFDDYPLFEYEKIEDGESLEVVIYNRRVYKKISFYFLAGVNFQNAEYFNLDVRIEYFGKDKNKHKWTWFMLADYCKHLKLEQVNYYYKHGQTEEERVEIFFDFVKDTMLNHGLLDVLMSEDWQVIPIDLSPYK